MRQKSERVDVSRGAPSLFKELKIRIEPHRLTLLEPVFFEFKQLPAPPGVESFVHSLCSAKQSEQTAGEHGTTF